MIACTRIHPAWLARLRLTLQLRQCGAHAALAALLSTLLLFAAPLAAQDRTWEPVGPDSGTVLSMAHQPSNSAVMLAGTYFGGLYRSTDWGYNWRPVNVPFASTSVFALQWDPLLPSRVYAGLFQEGAWRSDDAGQNWQKVSAGLLDGSVQALGIDPAPGAASMRLLAATPSGLYRSTDGAGSWSPVASLAGLSTRTIAHDPTRPGTVYVGTIGAGLFRSVDGGAQFAAVPSGERQRNINSLAIDAAGRLFAASDSGVFQLAADGLSWLDLNFNLPPNQAVEQVLPHPTAPDVLMVATAVGSYVISNWQAGAPQWYLWSVEGARAIATDRQGLQVHIASQIGRLRATVDFGTTFSRADWGIQTSFIGGLASGVLDGRWTLLAGTELGVFERDFATPWQLVLPLREGVFDLQMRGSTAYAGSEASGVFKSIDGGRHWQGASDGLTPINLRSLALTAEPSPVLLAASGGGAYRSTDGGANWEPVRLTALSYANVVSADPARPPIVWLAGSGGRVFRSLDRGISFNDAGAGLPDEPILALAHSPWSAVHALTASGRMYSTTTDGAGWFPAAAYCSSAPAVAIQVDPSRGWVMYLATAGGGVCKSESGGLSWSAVNTGIDAPGLVSLWLDPAQPQRLWTGGVGRIYRSSNGGQTWQAQASALPATPVLAITSDPQQANRVWAVLLNHGLYESIDGGQTWLAVSTGAAPATALSLLADTGQPGRLWVGTANLGVQRSSDSGRNWSSSSRGMSLFVRSIAIDPAEERTLYATSFNGGVFRSTDAAANWTNVGLTAGNAFRLRSPSPGRVLVGTSNGIAESRDGGTQWSDLGQRLGYVFSALVDPADAKRVLLGSSAGQMRVGDGGPLWQPVGTALPRTDILALAGCSDGSVLAAPERSGVWRSRFDTLAQWTNPGSQGLDGVQVVALACDSRSGLVYAASNGNGMWLSLNGGASWNAINAGISGRVMSAVLVSPTTPWQVWAAVRDGTVYRSSDGGQQWAAAGAGLPVGGVSHLAAGSDGMLYAATANGLFRRAPAAATWSAAAALPAGAIGAVWADPRRVGGVMVAQGAALWRSTDSGSSWTPVATGTGSTPILALAGAGDGARLWAATSGRGVAWSDNQGASFSPGQAATAIPLVVLDLGLDGVDPNTLYAASGGQGLLVSRDAGATWTLANAGLPTLELLAVAAHPQRAGEVYIGGREGVFMSRDHGLSWQALNNGLINKNATALQFDLSLPDALFVGLEGGGIWYLDTRP
jgi:photosystem II stability/assembly factor-like uncharacterized protein